MPLPDLALVCLLPAVLAPFALAQDDLAKRFQDPPKAFRPHTWWHWMNGNITKEGITADLEAMREVGLGGAQIFNVSESIPEGPAPFLSEAWRALFRHAVAEADRLGLELCLHNCAGWSSSGGPWIAPEQAMQEVVTAETRAKGPARFDAALPRPRSRHDCYRDIAVLAFPTPADAKTRLADIRPKAGYEVRYGQDPKLDAYPAEAIVARERIVDLTRHLDPTGRLSWDVPAGDWTILRVGYTPTGAVNAPSPDTGRGLECDKLSRQGLDAHWKGIMEPLLQDLGPLAPRTLRNLLIDSYEVGHQNWTAELAAEFEKRRRYDPVPFLPVLTGRVVDSGEVTERFLWDLRRTIGDLFTDCYYSHFAKRCHDAGLMASVEPYDGPFECLQVGRDADIPMGEFWVGGGESVSCKLAASVAHVFGKPIVGAEAFTAEPSRGRWLNHPFALKPVGDLMYATGINRYIVHRYAHQPWLDREPGMTMGQWGTHFERTTTWWKQGAAWLQYLSRCQLLLQQGRFVADVCFFAGESAPNGAVLHPEIKAAGYDYDSFGSDALMAMSVEGGELVLPSGMRYRLLVLPDTQWMTPGIAAKVRRLVAAGATVLGPRPVRSPSLADRGQGDETVRAIAAEVWGEADGKAVAEHAFGDHSFGSGRVVWGRQPIEVLSEMKVARDCAFSEASRRRLAWIHRATGETDLWFVSNQRQREEWVDCTFRVSGRQPELWHPDTGVIEDALVWEDDGRTTTLPIRLDPVGSVFVVFRKPAPARHWARWARPDGPARSTPKIEIRAARYEAVDGAGGSDVTAKVALMVRQGETSIPANNATFGDPTFLHVKRLRIDFTIDGRETSRTADENGQIDLVEVAPFRDLPDWRLVALADGRSELTAFAPGKHVLTTGQAPADQAYEVEPLRALAEPRPPQTIVGPWTLAFPPGRGAPPSVVLEELRSWTEHPDPGVRWFSGTAQYETRFEVRDAIGEADVVVLDLGQVEVIAEVTWNGKDLGVWWKPPFAADVTRLVRRGDNALRVRVTNLWVNRLIGDEQIPDDCQWNGKPILAWPDWLAQGLPRPAKERVTFTTWKHWTKDAQPLPSGLIGPVTLRWGARIVLPASKR